MVNCGLCGSQHALEKGRSNAGSKQIAFFTRARGAEEAVLPGTSWAMLACRSTHCLPLYAVPHLECVL